LVLLGPLRRPFFGSWRFNVPALVCGLVAWLVAGAVTKPGDPAWFPLGLALFVALGAGAAVKNWLDKTLGK
jgi:hypothetical protein